jgi:hypothetical protein
MLEYRLFALLKQKCIARIAILICGEETLADGRGYKTLCEDFIYNSISFAICSSTIRQ